MLLGRRAQCTDTGTVHRAMSSRSCSSVGDSGVDNTAIAETPDAHRCHQSGLASELAQLPEIQSGAPSFHRNYAVSVIPTSRKILLPRCRLQPAAGLTICSGVNLLIGIGSPPPLECGPTSSGCQNERRSGEEKRGPSPQNERKIFRAWMVSQRRSGRWVLSSRSP